MAEAVESGRRPMKENIFLHHRFPVGPAASHSLAVAEICQTCNEKKTAVARAVKNRDAKIVALKTILKQWSDAQEGPESFDKRMDRTLELLGQ